MQDEYEARCIELEKALDAIVSALEPTPEGYVLYDEEELFQLNEKTFPGFCAAIDAAIDVLNGGDVEEV